MISRALVAGGGIGGMSAALALKRAGVFVDLIDSDPEWRVQGAGISLTGVSLRAFANLGVYDEVSNRGFIALGSRARDPEGHVVMESGVPADGEPLDRGGGIMRPVLHDILAKRVRGAGVSVTLGVKVIAFDQDADGVDVTFSDGRQARYDLLVGAEGIFSPLRAMLFPDALKPQLTGQGVWRVVADRPADMDRTEFSVDGPAIVGMNPCSQAQLYMFILEPAEGNPFYPPEQHLSRMRTLLKGFGGPIGMVRDGLDESSVINYRPLEWLLLPDPWYRGRVVLIGDSAHATTPHLASGAGMAVEDGLVLAEELTMTDDLAVALRGFMDRRFNRARLVVESSVAIGKAQLAGELRRATTSLGRTMEDLRLPY